MSPSLVDLIADYFDARQGQPIPPRPEEPEQTYLLGGKYYDYALAFVFALAFPLLRMTLRALIFEVSWLVLSHPMRFSSYSIPADCQDLPP